MKKMRLIYIINIGCIAKEQMLFNLLYPFANKKWNIDPVTYSSSVSTIETLNYKMMGYSYDISGFNNGETLEDLWFEINNNTYTSNQIFVGWYLQPPMTGSYKVDFLMTLIKNPNIQFQSTITLFGPATNMNPFLVPYLIDITHQFYNAGLQIQRQDLTVLI